MAAARKKREPQVGAYGYENWLAFCNDKRPGGRNECLLYSDTWLTGEVTTGLGPYQFFNLLPTGYSASGSVRPAAVLGYSLHVEHKLPELDKTDESRYCSGTIVDELAALASLLCGVRLRAGATTRWFQSQDDPQGRPVWWSERPEPVLSAGLRNSVLPVLRSDHSIMPLENLKSYTRLTPEQSIALVRSARLYQDALWLAESEPNLSWIMLVSAVESAASQWRRSSVPSLQLLREFSPDLLEYLDAAKVEGLSARIAKEFGHLTKSSASFVDFIIQHLPQPPEKRPAEWAQVEWTEAWLRKALKTIYGYRSNALHSGVPFPVPMCEPPLNFREWDAPAEKPHAAAMSAGGGTWLAKDTPMLLQTFEYIARNAINAWWTSPGDSEQ